MKKQQQLVYHHEKALFELSILSPQKSCDMVVCLTQAFIGSICLTGGELERPQPSSLRNGEGGGGKVYLTIKG